MNDPLELSPADYLKYLENLLDDAGARDCPS
jgi:hypothetical protein